MSTTDWMLTVMKRSCLVLLARIPRLRFSMIALPRTAAGLTGYGSVPRALLEQAAFPATIQYAASMAWEH
jgi:hypothetical protein